nr:ribosome maturation factor RimP [Oceanococcus sp. HetDA_MAG_MS8]
MPLARDIEALIAPTIEGLGYELLCLEFAQAGHDTILRVYIDHANGIGLEDCETVSRALSAQLEVEDPIPEAYRLEVSSPGWDRPLVKEEHFLAFVGSEAKVKMAVPLDGRRNFRGFILSASDGQVQLLVDGTEFSIPLADVDRARLVPDPNAPQSS